MLEAVNRPRSEHEAVCSASKESNYTVDQRSQYKMKLPEYVMCVYAINE